jgi:hypothetical protein
METHIKNELIVISIIVFVSFLTFSQFDALEKIVMLSSKYEHLEIDELVSSSIVLSICLAVFSVRRWKEVLRYNKLLMMKNDELQKAFNEIRVLRGILPTCSYCKKIKSSDGIWKQMETFIDSNSEAQFSFGICPKCNEMPMRD